LATVDLNDIIRTGPGTLAGRYLRLFWQPIYRSRDLAPGHAVAVRLMGEDFTLYRGESGQAQLLASRCAHRGTLLSTGWVEGDCLRCFYHGWQYDADGQCVDQPGEDRGFAAKVRIASYPTREYLGLIFVYLGEGDPPEFRRFPDFEGPGVLEAGEPEYWPCNYFNRLDNARDGAHVPWTHSESLRRTGASRPVGAASSHAEETEYGIRSWSERQGKPSYYTHFHMPNINQNRSFARVEGSLEDAATLWVDRLFWRVPIDDESCVSFVVDLVPLTGDEGEAYRQRRRQTEESQRLPLRQIGDDILAGKMRISDIGEDISIYKLFWIEDYVVQVGQGSVADRSRERLGRVDTGVLLLRKLWLRELKALAEDEPVKQWQSVSGRADSAATPAARASAAAMPS